MEILSQTNHWFKYIGGACFVSMIVIITFIVGISFIKDILFRKERTLNEFTGAFCCILFAIMMGMANITLIKQGVPTTYKAKVSDWNKVYDQGYKVVEQNGNIVTLEKVKKYTN